MGSILVALNGKMVHLRREWCGQSSSYANPFSFTMVVCLLVSVLTYPGLIGEVVFWFCVFFVFCFFFLFFFCFFLVWILIFNFFLSFFLFSLLSSFFSSFNI